MYQNPVVVPNVPPAGGRHPHSTPKPAREPCEAEKCAEVEVEEIKETAG